MTSAEKNKNDPTKDLLTAIGALRSFNIEHPENNNAVDDFKSFLAHNTKVNFFIEAPYGFSLQDPIKVKKFPKHEEGIVKDIYHLCYKDFQNKKQEDIDDLIWKVLSFMKYEAIGGKKTFFESIVSFCVNYIAGAMGTLSILVILAYIIRIEQEKSIEFFIEKIKKLD